jgi:predicted RNA-binding protein associated with RNAse of E/G family
MDSFSALCGDGQKRVLKADILTTGEKSKSSNDAGELSPEKISLEKLKELKNALELGLITEEEYKKAKEKFLN